AMVQLSNKEQLLFACTHLCSQRDSTNRMLQIKAIGGLLRNSTTPIVIAGDFNATPDSHVIRTLDTHFTRTCAPCEFTFPADQPKHAIDFIAFAPLEKFSVKDHQAV